MSDRSATFDEEISAAFADLSEDQPTSTTAPEGTDQPESPVAVAPTDAPVVPPTDQVTAPASTTPAQTPSTPVSPEAPALDAGTPFPFRADGRDLAIPGATRLADGSIRIPSESLPHLQRHLADRSAVVERERGFRQQIQQLTDRKSADEVKAKTLLTHIGKLGEMTPEQLADWAIGFREQLPVLQQQAEVAALRAQLEDRDRTLQPIQQERQRAEEEPVIRDAISTYVQRMATAAELAGLDVQAAMPAVMQMFSHLYMAAPADDPETGITKGSTVINLDLLANVLRQQHGAQQQIRQAKESAAAQAKAAQANAAALAQPTTARPTAPAPAQRTRDDSGKFTKKNESFDEEWAAFNPLAE